MTFDMYRPLSHSLILDTICKLIHGMSVTGVSYQHIVCVTVLYWCDISVTQVVSKNNGLKFFFRNIHHQTCFIVSIVWPPHTHDVWFHPSLPENPNSLKMKHCNTISIGLKNRTIMLNNHALRTPHGIEPCRNYLSIHDFYLQTEPTTTLDQRLREHYNSLQS